MFGNLFSKKDKSSGVPAFSYITYISTEAKFNALAEMAKADNNLHFIAWFPDTVRKLQTLFTRLGLESSRIHEARHFHGGMINSDKTVLAEPHPLIEKEKTLVQHWQQKEVKVYCALDEPFLKIFGSDKIIGLMEKMGMKADEPLEHKFISQSIMSAQEKIASKVKMEQSASSQSEWMEKNLK